MQLNLEQIRLDGGTQPRAELLIEVMEDYAELLRNGVELPPVDVFFDGKEYWLADGFHRVGAALRARPDQPIEAQVHQGTQSDAQWYSFGVNTTHGLRRTNEDKERIVRSALQHPNASQLSNVQLSRHCGVNEKTIRKYRNDQGASSEVPKMRTVSRGGTSYQQNTTNIGKKPRSQGNNRRNGTSRSRLPVHKPTRELGIMEKMTAVTLPHNPVMGAVALINVFDIDYLLALVEELTKHLKGPQE